MRPTASRTSSQDPNASNLQSSKAWGLPQDQQQQPISILNDQSFQQQQQPSSFTTQGQKNGNSRVYSIEDLLSVWQEIQEKIKNGESVESYRSLSPIKALVEQVERDRSFQSDLKKDDPQVAEITEKLNEITRWAKNENPSSAQNRSSLLSNGASTASPFLGNKSLLNDGSLNSPYARSGTPSADAQLGQRSLSLLQPHQIKWYYLDPTGNQQGPFDGTIMQSWYTGGYLTPDLNLRREYEFTYYPLQQFVSLVNNYLEPFHVPLPDLKPQPQSIPFQQNMSFDQQLPGFFNQGFSSQSQSQIPQVQNAQQNWSSNSGRSSPWINQSALATDPVATQDFRIGAQSPFMNTSFNNQSSSSLAKTSSVDASVQHDHVDLLNQIHSKVINNVLQDEEEVKDQQIAAQAAFEQPQPVETETPVKEAPKETKPVASAQKAAIAAVSKPAKSEVPTENKTSGNVAVEASKVLKTETAQPTAPKLAPWANKSVSKAPQLTLEQIQRLEAEESEKQAKAKAKQDKLLAAQLLANTEKSIKESTAPKTILPSTSSWGTPTKATAAPAKTLLDIQREEAEAAAAASAGSSNSASSTPMKKVASSKGSFASIVTSSAPPANAWTVVSSNKKPVPKTQAPKITSGPKPVTPDVLRSVSSSTAAQIQPTSTFTKTVSPRQDFLSWSRTSMKLNKGVNKEEVLQIMLMLPVGSESSEIIADTIYSNSSTMDGRRFAQEFMKRRKAVEDQAHDGLSWNEALRISAEDDNDGWDFQVVGKKKKGRN